MKIRHVSPGAKQRCTGRTEYLVGQLACTWAGAAVRARRDQQRAARGVPRTLNSAAHCVSVLVTSTWRRHFCWGCAAARGTRSCDQQDARKPATRARPPDAAPSNSKLVGTIWTGIAASVRGCTLRAAHGSLAPELRNAGFGASGARCSLAASNINLYSISTLLFLIGWYLRISLSKNNIGTVALLRTLNVRPACACIQQPRRTHRADFQHYTAAMSSGVSIGASRQQLGALRCPLPCALRCAPAFLTHTPQA